MERRLGYAAALAPGSYVVLSVGRTDDAGTAQGFGNHRLRGAGGGNRPLRGPSSPVSTVLVPPAGVADARVWHPDAGQSAPLPPRAGQALVGVARV